jgi:HAD superfamily hydrolase (TIGR01459 family)
VPSIPLWPAIAPHASRYDAWLCDIWGVLHNGAAAYRPAADACAAFRGHGGRVILVSNAPRPAAAVAAQLAGLGITAASYDAILTSGDVTRVLLGDMPPMPLYLLGPERHRMMLDGLAHAFVDEADAQMVLCSGLFERDTNETPEHYRSLLQRLAARRLRLLCANPDLTADAGGTIIHCAGGLAAIYEQLGGEVIYAGKPHAAVYIAARKMLTVSAGREIARERILAIGDGVNTDIRGAYTAGIDALYIASRVHLSESYSADAVARLFSAHAFHPAAAMSALAW